MKLKQRKFIIILSFILCLIFLCYMITTKYKFPNNDFISDTEKTVCAFNEKKEVHSILGSAAAESSINTSEKATDEHAEDTSNIDNIISDQTTSVLKGTIDKQNIAMAIYRDGNELTASFFTTNETEPETRLLGTLNVNPSSVRLINEDRNLIFEGSLKSDPSKGELFTGIFKNSMDKTETDFNLTLSYTVGNTIDDRYPYIDAKTADIEDFAKKIKLYIMGNKEQELAELIDYPISLTINNEKKSIHSSREFVQYYNDIITEDFKNKVTNSYTKYLFSNSMGVMLGDGEIWFDLLNDKELKIYAINN